MPFFIITSFITAFASIFLGVLVYIKNKKSAVNKLFGFYTLGVFIWSFSYGTWLLQDNPIDALFWSRMLNMGATLIPIAYLHWVLVFLKKEKEKKVILIFGYIITLFFLLFSFNNYYIKGVAPISFFPYWPQANWLYFLYLAFNYCSMVIYGSYLLYKGIKITFGFYKEQIKYAFAGSVIGFIGGASNFPLMLGIDLLPPIGNPFTIAFPLFFAYAIIRHRLMDIKFVLRKSSVYLASLATILILVGMVKYAVIRFFVDIYNWVDFIILILAIMIFLPIRNYYYKIANKYFFTSMYDSRKVIGKLSDKLRSTLELKRIYGHISDVLFDTFHVKAMGILIRDKKDEEINRAKSGGEDRYIVRYNKGFNIGGNKKFPGNKKLCNLFLKHNKSIVVEEIKSANYKEFKGTIDLLTSFGAAVVTPLNIKGKVTGLIILGQKESGDMYNDQDLRVLEIVGAQAAIAIENAVLYEAAKNFNVKLKKEVEEATVELRAANEELKRLDVAKSEFISIASHQLRTPLTIIKGYISMLIEGSFGRLTDKETDALKKVFESNERLIQLVEDLLDISRVESGRLRFNFKEISLEQIVDSAVNEIAPIAQKRGLELKYKIANKLLPKVKIDEEKIRQVIINLLDNAIKYTEKGSITVELSRAGGNIHFCITDTGRGIRKNEFSSLFKKFSRGKGTFLIDTTGNGLGLYIGKMMIEAHHGKIWAESEGEGKGAKFCFDLPIKNMK